VALPASKYLNAQGTVTIMPWKQQGGGGGPWGGGSGSDGRGGGGGGPWGRGGGGGGAQPPDFEEMLRKSQDRVKRFIPGGFGSGRGILFAVLGFLVLWLIFGGIFYRVQPDEQGVVLRFGKWVDTTSPGLHFKLPAPIDTVVTPKVTRVNRILVGVQGSDLPGRSTGRDIPEESLMLTGDENIVDIDFTVFWKIKDAGKFLFNIRNPEGTVKVVAESAMREVIGQTRIQSALTEGRSQIESVTHERVQKLIDEYGAGVQIEKVQLLKVDPPQPVIDAFIDVQRARADEERIQNEATAYANDILPRARGEAEKMIQEANAYKEQIVNKAQGEAQRFLEVYDSYKIAKDITKQRLYLETFEEVFRGMNKVIIDRSASGGPGVVPYLPLPELQKRSQSGNRPTGGGQ
jgi:membrane protease subunit HflK